MVKQPTIVNATSHMPTIILLIVNLIATIAVLAHLFYYTPSSTSGAAAATDSDIQAPKNMVTNGIGTVGLDNTNRVQFDLIKIEEEGADPEVVQTVTVTQQDFLNSLERFSSFRELLEEKDLIRRNEE